jgi:hypothetical protein
MVHEFPLAFAAGLARTPGVMKCDCFDRWKRVNPLGMATVYPIPAAASFPH